MEDAKSKDVVEGEELQEARRHPEWDHALGWSVSYLQSRVDSWAVIPGTDGDLQEGVADAVGHWPFDDGNADTVLFGYAMDEAYNYVRARGRLEGRVS